MVLDDRIVIRVDDAWLDRCDLLLNVIEGNGKARTLSKVVRDLVVEESDLWIDSPYIATNSSHFLYVAASRNVYYRSLQQLLLRSRREKLPASISMTPEQQRFYLRKYQGDPLALEKIRSHWILNHFAVWPGLTTDKPAIATYVDRLGLMSKTADLRIDRGQDSSIVREIVAVLRDCVQEKKDKRDRVDNRIDISIDMPTLNLDIQIIVDRELYDDSDDETRDDAALSYEYRNLETAKLARSRIHTRVNPATWNQDRFPDARNVGRRFRPTLEEVRTSFGAFRERILSLAEPDLLAQDKTSIVEDNVDRSLLQSLRLPPSFLFGRLTWRRPYHGLGISLAWNKLDR